MSPYLIYITIALIKIEGQWGEFVRRPTAITLFGKKLKEIRLRSLFNVLVF